MRRHSNSEFFEWLADRLVFVYGESPNVDFVLRLRELRLEEIAKKNAEAAGPVQNLNAESGNG